MTVIQTKYFPGKYGLATEFSLSQMPLEYSRTFNNRFINIRGDAEKRQGIKRLGAAITGTPTITGLHEYVDRLGVSTLFASGSGVIYRYSSTTLTWSVVLTGKDPTQRLLSVQMGEKLIFVNGSDRNFYTDDAGNTFTELKAIIESGGTASGTTTTVLTDSAIPNWLSTFVTNNDIIFNATCSGYGVVTSVGASNLTCSLIGAGGTGIGQTPAINQTSGQKYEIIDTVALNIIPTLIGDDNFATITSGSNATRISVSPVDFSTTEARIGDFVYNTTRNALTRINSVSANLVVTSVAGQTVNDTVTFLKSAMPIAAYPHVHYGKLYLIDARQRAVVRVSGPNDPQDFTTNQDGIEAITEFYSTRQPQAEILLTLDTFQQYLIAGGQRNVYADSGTNPIATTAQARDFQPVGLFPQGCVSRYGIESIGGACVVAANDGLRNFNATFNAATFQTANISEAIKSELADAIATKANDPDEIQCVHYPRRNWLLFKVGDVIYNYNYTPYYSAGQIQQSQYGSFSKFTGPFAQQKIYYIRRNGDLICAGAGGLVYEFDKGTYSDDGNSIPTAMETGYLKLNEAQEDTQIKTGTYIKPIFETSAPIDYTITATGGYDQLSTDSVELSTSGVGQVGFATIGYSPIGGNRIYDNKQALRWKGERFRIRIDTDSINGPDIITGYTIYGNILGKV